jgi:hypothetical protein
VVATLALTACDRQEAPQVASASRPAEASPAATAPAGTGTTTAAKETDYDKALRYTRCMTANGVPMPDPEMGKALPIGKPPDPANHGFQEFDVAPFTKCKQFLPATWPVKWDPDMIARFRPFNECMRKRGIDVAEPDADGMLPDRTDPLAPRSAEYRAAEDACRYLIPS